MCNRNDYRRLKAEADIRAVVEYCGIRFGKRSGNAQFVACPNPEHDDQHPTNAYFRDGWNTVFCTTCNKNMGPIDILMWNQGISYGEAADILWELEGCPDWYYANKPDKPGPEKEVRFFLSRSELAFLGIRIPGTAYLPVRYSKYRAVKPEDLEAKHIYSFLGEGYHEMKAQSIDWQDFISEATMRELVVSRCDTMENEITQMAKDLDIAGLCQAQLNQLHALRERARKGSGNE